MKILRSATLLMFMLFAGGMITSCEDEEIVITKADGDLEKVPPVVD